MDCETATPLIEALCDDELDVATAARLVAHLEGCAACSAVRREAETRQSALREARPVDHLPEGVRARLVREVVRIAPARGKASWRRPAALAAGVVLAAGLAAGYALTRAGQPRPPA
ncbi:MAG: zf-HC2 domain-containing protein, partial [Thermoanaerobaculia bacterium]|nr:zf-HC2 domain-containing protein [Thermoanaerobaculia bacterium]